ncbi:MAG: carboxylating nicotinate-nucleotide diphosphorylase [bacterium]|nr:carboxylating nicotinate-nucleotide diphosphorylase [bacterium]
MDKQMKSIIKRALKEDMPQGCISTECLFDVQESSASLIAKENGILSGVEVFKEVYRQVDPFISITFYKKDRDVISKGEVLAQLHGKTKYLLQGERVALNFLQRMSGIATMTHRYVLETGGTKASIYDTRKTTPTLRVIQRQAVLDGGGCNHRLNLSTMVMLKDNHIAACSSLSQAVEKVRQQVNEDMLIEVEVESLAQFMEAQQTSADIIMLDNMSTSLMKECVRQNHANKIIEASGNMVLERIKEVAEVGVDMISVGALTHSYSSLDISLRFSKKMEAI